MPWYFGLIFWVFTVGFANITGRWAVESVFNASKAFRDEPKVKAFQVEQCIYYLTGIFAIVSLLVMGFCGVEGGVFVALATPPIIIILKHLGIRWMAS